MVCLARLMRCAIVASGTRNARAISAVVRPPTARSVRAMADGRVSAGWQHITSRFSVSSWSAGVTASGGGAGLGRHLDHHHRFAAAAGDLGANLVGEASAGDVDQPPARAGGEPRFRPLQRRRQERLLDRVLGGGEIPEPAHDRGEHLRRQLAQQVLGNRCHSCGGALITWRTSIGMFIGTPPFPGAAEARAAIA